MTPHEFTQYVRDNNITHYGIIMKQWPIAHILDNMEVALEKCQNWSFALYRNGWFACDVSIKQTCASCKHLITSENMHKCGRYSDFFSTENKIIKTPKKEYCVNHKSY